MLEPLVIPAVNRLLARNAWALETLRGHAGKQLALNVPPLTLRFTVSELGDLTAATREDDDATLTLTPALLLRFAARDENAWKDVKVSGDTALASAIDYVRRNLEWDFEEDLSFVFGDIAAHRMANGIRAFEAWGRNAASGLGRAVAEYATHEQPVVASAEALEMFARDVDELRGALDAVEKRIERLKRR